MRTLNVSPLFGVDCIILGKARREVHSDFGVPESSYLKVPSALHETDGWHGGAVQVFYAGTSPAVEYIELSHSPDIEALLFGVSVFATPAADLVARLEPKCRFDVEEAGSLHVCVELELAFWRPTSDDTYFATVGIGGHGYFSGGAA